MYLNPPLHEYNRHIFSQNTITIIHVLECWNKLSIFTHTTFTSILKGMQELSKHRKLVANLEQ